MSSDAERLQEEYLASYDENVSMVFRHCLLRVRDRERALDITQEAFTRTWVYIAAGKDVKYLRAFLFRVTNNLIVDSARKKKSASLDALIEEDNFEPKDESAPEPRDKPAEAEAMKLLAGLDDKYRAVITMRYVDEMAPKEIARALGITENAVSVRIHRGLARLQALFNSRP